jgi:hypothetical protein
MSQLVPTKAGEIAAVIPSSDKISFHSATPSTQISIANYSGEEPLRFPTGVKHLQNSE